MTCDLSHVNHNTKAKIYTQVYMTPKSMHWSQCQSPTWEQFPWGCKQLSRCVCHWPKGRAQAVFAKANPIIGKFHVLSYSREGKWRLLRALGENLQFQAVSMLWVILFWIEKNRAVTGNSVKNSSSTVWNSLINIWPNPGTSNEYKDNDLIVFIIYVA